MPSYDPNTTLLDSVFTPSHRSPAMFRVSLRVAFLASTIAAAPAAGLLARSMHQQQVQTAPSSVDTAITKSYRWRSIGPDRGGRSIAVSGVKGRPREAYFGAVG